MGDIDEQVVAQKAKGLLRRVQYFDQCILLVLEAFERAVDQGKAWIAGGMFVVCSPFGAHRRCWTGHKFPRLSCIRGELLRVFQDSAKVHMTHRAIAWFRAIQVDGKLTGQLDRERIIASGSEAVEVDRDQGVDLVIVHEEAG